MNIFKKGKFTCLIATALVLLINLPVAAQVIRTAAEESDFENYTSYEEMLEFMQQVQASSTEMMFSDFGTTIEGRLQPYAVLSRPLITQPWEAFASGKPIVLLNANIHGGERIIRESLLLLLRDLADPDSAENRLLDDMVIIIVPSVNPDGFVRASRGNSVGLDLNRDFIKLEQPATWNYTHNILLTWQPHIYMDGHNGGAYPYNICYESPTHAATNLRLINICDEEIFPYISQEMEFHGYKAWYYSGGNRTAWRGGGTNARDNSNYGGFMNSISILFESPRQDRADGAKSGYIATRALLEYVADNPDKIINYVTWARRETIELGQKARGDIAIEVTRGPMDYKVSYLIAEGRGEQRKIIEVTDADLLIKPVVTKTRPRPYAYLLEARAYKAIELLKKHSITIEVLQEDVELDIEAYNMIGINHRSVYDHPASVSVTCDKKTIKRKQTFTKGSYVVRTGQMQGRLVTHMLEPETNDNVLTWNTLDAILPRTPGRSIDPKIVEGQDQPRSSRPAIIPIYKLMTPVALPTKILKN
ncbi:MAG: hypothetical protein AMJ79_10070 [Phycisphaerae bacterium SM23_30]|nr:MAG: hypothetical protein AMJ79_10070 [Phycisphaerae bacterium SM23_30]